MPSESKSKPTSGPTSGSQSHLFSFPLFLSSTSSPFFSSLARTRSACLQIIARVAVHLRLGAAVLSLLPTAASSLFATAQACKSLPTCPADDRRAAVTATGGSLRRQLPFRRGVSGKRKSKSHHPTRAQSPPAQLCIAHSATLVLSLLVEISVSAHSLVTSTRAPPTPATQFPSARIPMWQFSNTDAVQIY